MDRGKYRMRRVHRDKMSTLTKRFHSNAGVCFTSDVEASRKGRRTMIRLRFRRVSDVSDAGLGEHPSNAIWPDYSLGSIPRTWDLGDGPVNYLAWVGCGIVCCPRKPKYFPSTP